MLFWFSSVIKKQKGKRHLKKTQKKANHSILLPFSDLWYDTLLFTSWAGSGYRSHSFFIRLYIVSPRRAWYLNALSFFVLYNTITTHSRRRRREVQKWIIICLARKWKLEVLVLCFWYFSHFGRNWGWTSQAGLNILADGESIEARRAYGYCHFHSSFDLPGKKHVLDSTLYCN